MAEVEPLVSFTYGLVLMIRYSSGNTFSLRLLKTKPSEKLLRAFIGPGLCNPTTSTFPSNMFI